MPSSASDLPSVADCRLGERTVARVDVEYVSRADGPLDRKVVVTRDCGHTYFWGGPLRGPLPAIGSRAMHCLGPQDARFVEDPSLPLEDALFDPRKRPVKRRRPRPGEP